MSVRRGQSASRRARTVPLQLELLSRLQQYAHDAVTGEIYKMELDGTMLGKFGIAGKQLGRIQYGA